MKIEIRLNQREFIKFGVFDTFCCKKSWRRPALFAAILGAAAAVCFVLHQRRGAVLLGSVLMATAVGLPAAYFLSFFLSLRKQALGLAGAKHVYTLELEKAGIAVDNGHEHAVYPWEKIFRAYRRANATYLYITPQRAFLIPHDCVEGGADSLWALLERRVPADRRRS